MGWPVVTVGSGGIPVTDTLGSGTPVEEAVSGFGVAVTYVASGGLSVTGGAGLGFQFLAASDSTPIGTSQSQTIAVRVV